METSLRPKHGPTGCSELNCHEFVKFVLQEEGRQDLCLKIGQLFSIKLERTIGCEICVGHTAYDVVMIILKPAKF